jgi:hypothetical protein
MNIKAKKIVSLTTGLALVASLAVALPALAATNEAAGQVNGTAVRTQMMSGRKNGQGIPGMMNRSLGAIRSVVSGTVSGVSGNTITVNGRQGFGSTTATVSYTINATNATFRKNNATSTVSSIVVGDTIFAQGTVTGTNVVATSITDGAFGRMMGARGGSGNGPTRSASSTLAVIGNGEPVVAGTVSQVSGSTLTIATASNVIYTVDVSNAKVLKGQNTVALSTVVAGDKVVVQGTVSGTSIVASTVIDQNAPVVGSIPPGQAKKSGFFGGVGQFFMHLFGF